MALLNDRDLDRLFSGRPIYGGPNVQDVESFIRRLGETVPEPSVEAMESTHIAAIMAAVQEVPAAAPSTPAVATRSVRLFGFRRRIAASVMVAFGSFGGMAYAGVLPAPVQEAIARVADRIGIAIPGLPDERRDGGGRDREVVPPDEAEDPMTGSDDPGGQEDRIDTEDRSDSDGDRRVDRDDRREGGGDRDDRDPEGEREHEAPEAPEGGEPKEGGDRERPEAREPEDDREEIEEEDEEDVEEDDRDTGRSADTAGDVDTVEVEIEGD